MRFTSKVFRATQAMTSPETSRVVAEAAKRVSQRQKRSRGLRKYADLIVVGLATAVAATAVKNKYLYEEKREKLELRVEQLEEERDIALNDLDHTRQRLLTKAREGVQAASRSGEQGLQDWIRSVLNEPRVQEEPKQKPRVI